MTRVVLLLLFLAPIFVAGCEKRVTAHDNDENPPNVSEAVVEANQGDGAYCFYEVRDLVEDRTLEASEKRLALLRAMNKDYENGEILLPLLSSQGLIYYAEPCNLQIIEPIILEFGMTVSRSNYARYKEEYVSAHAGYHRISLEEANRKVPVPDIDDRFEDSAYCFFEMRETEEDRTSDASDVRSAILRAIDNKYESDEIFLEPLSVGRVIYYAEACNREIVEPIILGYGMAVTQSSDARYKEAYAASVARAGGFEIEE